jgi:hypothetical protein
MSAPAKGPQIRYVDRPEVSETFVDSFNMLFFDGTTLRIECCATRFDEPKPPGPPTGKKYPVARLVLSPNAITELMNQMQRIQGPLVASGIVKTVSPATGSPEKPNA